MKKILAILLAAMLMFGAVACTTDDANDTDTNDTNDIVDTNDTADTSSDTEAQDNGIIEPAIEDNTMGMNIWNLFLTTLAENPDKNCEELGNIFMSNAEVIPYGGMAMAAEEGLLWGFDNYEVKGFKSGAVFMPMIGSIPFVGYVFTLDEGADVDAFMQTLKDNADPRWNICTEAEETIIESADNMVFFVMCPAQFEE